MVWLFVDTPIEHATQHDRVGPTEGLLAEVRLIDLRNAIEASWTCHYGYALTGRLEARSRIS